MTDGEWDAHDYQRRRRRLGCLTAALVAVAALLHAVSRHTNRKAR